MVTYTRGSNEYNRRLSLAKDNCIKYIRNYINSASSNFSAKTDVGDKIGTEVMNKSLSVEKLLKCLYSLCNLDNSLKEEYARECNPNIVAQFSNMSSGIYDPLSKDELFNSYFYKFFDSEWRGIYRKFNMIYTDKGEQDKIDVSKDSFLQAMYKSSVNGHSHTPILEVLPEKIKNLVKYELATGKVRDSFHLSNLPSKEDFINAVDYLLVNKDFNLESSTKEALEDSFKSSNSFDHDRYMLWVSSPETRDFLAEFACSVYVVLYYELDLYEKGNDNDLFSSKELEWMKESSNMGISYEEMEYYCTFLKMYIRDRDFSFDLEKYGRINKLFSAIKNVNDLTQISMLISKWFNSIDIKQLSCEEIKELQKIDPKYFVSTLSYQDSVVYELCKQNGVAFQYYYKKYDTELIKKLGSIFSGSYIPYDAFFSCYSNDEVIRGFDWRVMNINLIVKLFRDYGYDINSIPGAAFYFDYAMFKGILDSYLASNHSLRGLDFALRNYRLIKSSGDYVKVSPDTINYFYNKDAIEIPGVDNFLITDPLERKITANFGYNVPSSYYEVLKGFVNNYGITIDDIISNIYYLKECGMGFPRDNYPLCYLKEKPDVLISKINYLSKYYFIDRIPENIFSMGLDEMKEFFRINKNDSSFYPFIEENGTRETIPIKDLYRIHLMLKKVKATADMMPLGISEIYMNIFLYRKYLREYNHSIDFELGEWLLYKWPNDFSKIIELCAYNNVYPYPGLFYFDINLLCNREFFSNVCMVLQGFSDSSVVYTYGNALVYQRNWLDRKGLTMDDISKGRLDIYVLNDDDNNSIKLAS